MAGARFPAVLGLGGDLDDRVDEGGRKALQHDEAQDSCQMRVNSGTRQDHDGVEAQYANQVHGGQATRARNTALSEHGVHAEYTWRGRPP